MNAETDKLFTIDEVADYCRVSPERIRQAARNHEIEYLDFGLGTKRSRNRRFTKGAVDRWLNSLRNDTQQNVIL